MGLVALDDTMGEKGEDLYRCAWNSARGQVVQAWLKGGPGVRHVYRRAVALRVAERDCAVNGDKLRRELGVLGIETEHVPFEGLSTVGLEGELG